MIKLDGMKKSLILASFIAGIILISIPSITAQSESGEIPSWIKGIASFWVEGNITDEEFVEVLEFLIENEVIVIEGYGKIDIPPEDIPSMESPEEAVGLTLELDKEIYNVGDKIIITGTVVENEISVSLVIVDYYNKMVSIFNVDPSNDTYSSEYITNDRFGVGVFEVRASQDGVNYKSNAYELVE